MQIRKPMLAATADYLDEIRFPTMVTPKLDGVRCLVVDGQATSRAFKPIPNNYVSDLVSRLPEGLDGELVLPEGDFNDSQSAFMRNRGKPDFRYAVFDWYRPGLDYWDRAEELKKLTLPDFCIKLENVLANDYDQLCAFEAECFLKGYEGIVARCPRGPYKFGRSTLREHWMVKYKRKQTAEALVIGFEEQYENLNPQVANAFGRMKRPGGAGGLGGYEPKGTLGAFLVCDIKTNVKFRVGTGRGLTEELRQEVWDNRDSYIGRVITYTFQPGKDKPRFPVFHGFRHEDDL